MPVKKRGESKMQSFGLMHESYEPDAPAYGTIPRTGGSWTVKYQDKKSTTGCIISGTRTGYGDFPFDEYRGLPVIDFSGQSFDKCFEGLKIMDRIKPAHDIKTLDAFIKAYQDIGIPVHMNGYEGSV